VQNDEKRSVGVASVTPVVLTIPEAARRLAVSQLTVRRLMADGALSRVVIGRSVRVVTRSLDELAERGGVSRAR